MGGALKSAPRSKRCEASVWMRWRFEERRTVAGSNQAASTRMFLVVAEMAVSRPPMTPARPTAFFSSAMTRSSGSRVRSTPSRVHELFAFAGAADDDAAFELVEVEGVGGVAHGEDDVVGGVDGVEDGFLVEEAEALGDDAGGGRDRHVAKNAGGEAAAEFGLFDGNRESSGHRVALRAAAVGMTVLCPGAAAASRRSWRLRGRCRSGSWRRRGWW